MSIERVTVIRAIRMYRETIAEVCANAPWLALPVHAGDPVVLGLILDLACARVGLHPAFYEAALHEDPELRELARLAVDELVAASPDPGPYAEISRESPAGTPANWHIHPWNGITPPGGVGGSWPPGFR